jgi:hypothetical protein
MAITNGMYKGRATGEVVLGESSNKGTPFIEVYFDIVEGDNKGWSVRWTSYFSEKTSKRTIESLGFCGWRGDDISEFIDGGLHGLDSNVVDVVVELEEYEKDGEKRTAPKVQWVNRAGGGRFLNVANAMSHDKAVSFAEKMRGLVMQVKAAQSADVDFPHGASAPVANGNAAPAVTPSRKAF